MAQITVRNLSNEAVEYLREAAERNKRSVEAEVRLILEELAARQVKRSEALKFLDEMRARSLPQTSDSADLIREDRER